MFFDGLHCFSSIFNWSNQLIGQEARKPDCQALIVPAASWKNFKHERSVTQLLDYCRWQTANTVDLSHRHLNFFHSHEPSCTLTSFSIESPPLPCWDSMVDWYCQLYSLVPCLDTAVMPPFLYSFLSGVSLSLTPYLSYSLPSFADTSSTLSHSSDTTLWSFTY